MLLQNQKNQNQKSKITLLLIFILIPHRTIKAENFFEQNALLIKGGMLYMAGIITGIMVHKAWSKPQEHKASCKEGPVKPDISLPPDSKKTKRESIHLSKGKVTGNLIKALFHDAEHSKDTEFSETIQTLPEHIRKNFPKTLIDDFYKYRTEYKRISDTYHNRTGELYTIISNLK